ncbi:hypothetical protein HDU79_009803 [Rhizoclosmatium sp. JEL0117]|nr:hypothetical protein HDU79_009803 [Rhizoclosmatium sp. JEL0117]
MHAITLLSLVAAAAVSVSASPDLVGSVQAWAVQLPSAKCWTTSQGALADLKTGDNAGLVALCPSLIDNFANGCYNTATTATATTTTTTTVSGAAPSATGAASNQNSRREASSSTLNAELVANVLANVIDLCVTAQAFVAIDTAKYVAADFTPVAVSAADAASYALGLDVDIDALAKAFVQTQVPLTPGQTVLFQGPALPSVAAAKAVVGKLTAANRIINSPVIYNFNKTLISSEQAKDNVYAFKADASLTLNWIGLSLSKDSKHIAVVYGSEASGFWISFVFDLSAIRQRRQNNNAITFTLISGSVPIKGTPVVKVPTTTTTSTSINTCTTTTTTTTTQAPYNPATTTTPNQIYKGSASSMSVSLVAAVLVSLAFF